MESSLRELIKQELGTSTLDSTGRGGGGCISEGSVYETDQGTVFIKVNSKPKALQMFEGEYESLAALKATGTVQVPGPIKIIKNPKGGAMLVMECVDISGLSRHAAALGEQMARLHLKNAELGKQAEKSSQSIHKGQYNGYTSKFGFPVTTCCGYLPQENGWMDSWPDFFARKIDQHVGFAEEKYGDREVRQIWNSLHKNLPKLFKDVGEIQPALLHGDLWGGNAGENDNGPIIFDPASFYGHSEYDLAISKMFGGFSGAYFSSYHKLIPKQPGFDDRLDLYMMFHYFNHWNHFGGGYKDSTLRIMKDLDKKYSK